MGGRGASSGTSKRGRVYGTEYKTVLDKNGHPLVVGNVKFVQKTGKDSETLIETMTRGRVYVEVSPKGELMRIVYFDNQNLRAKQIDLQHPHKMADGTKLKPHTHHGYLHNESDGKSGAAHLTTEERALVDRVTAIWKNRGNGG